MDMAGSREGKEYSHYIEHPGHVYPKIIHNYEV